MLKDAPQLQPLPPPSGLYNNAICAPPWFRAKVGGPSRMKLLSFVLSRLTAEVALYFYNKQPFTVLAPLAGVVYVDSFD